MEQESRLLESLDRKRYGEAFEYALELYEKKVYRLAVMMLRDPGRAEDATQEIFLRVWRSLKAYDGRAAFSTWIYTIARNTCLSMVRAEQLRRTEAIEDTTEPSVPAHTADGVDLERHMQALSDVQREAITLFYLQERNIDDVAAMLDLPAGTVKSHLHRARKILNESMRKP